MAKRIVSKIRAEAVYCLIAEFSFLFPTDSALEIVAKILKIKKVSALRYLRENSEKLKHNLFISGSDLKITESRCFDRLTKQNRALLCLERNDFSWDDIAKILKIKKPSAKRHFKRVKKTLIDSHLFKTYF